MAPRSKSEISKLIDLLLSTIWTDFILAGMTTQLSKLQKTTENQVTAEGMKCFSRRLGICSWLAAMELWACLG